MAKKVVGIIKLAIEAGKANPAPPIGPALGQRGHEKTQRDKQDHSHVIDYQEDQVGWCCGRCG